jgi:poly(3-hydroxybutyrate) depolymerase
MPLTLPTFNVDPSRISISGLSAGAFMAHQMHIAFSDIFCGAGLIAGGAYQVSRGSLLGALAFGLRGQLGSSPETLAQAARVLANSGVIAPIKNLEKSRVWVFHGSRDTTVPERVSDDLVSFYREFLKDRALEYVNNVEVVHAMPTDSFGSRIQAPSQSPFILNANYDAAGILLEHIHGRLKPRAEGTLRGEWRRFNQNAFLPGAQRHSMDDLGYAYIPRGAAAGKECGIHVALHGCGQSSSAIGDVFVRNAGYNEWAEANNFIMLYPQARPLVNFRVFNPQGSFDWWGLDDNDYALRSGRQMKAIANMVQTVAGQGQVHLQLAA